uniref:Uncharacterized protein n=1 Tax=Arundo donax TaxID=35708 RepID=A0A0A9DLA4_ARUDO
MHLQTNIISLFTCFLLLDLSLELLSYYLPRHAILSDLYVQAWKFHGHLPIFCCTDSCSSFLLYDFLN